MTKGASLAAHTSRSAGLQPAWQKTELAPSRCASAASSAAASPPLPPPPPAALAAAARSPPVESPRGRRQGRSRSSQGPTPRGARCTHACCAEPLHGSTCSWGAPPPPACRAAPLAPGSAGACAPTIVRHSPARSSSSSLPARCRLRRRSRRQSARKRARSSAKPGPGPGPPPTWTPESQARELGLLQAERHLVATSQPCACPRDICSYYD
jgi:hypothetical protein